MNQLISQYSVGQLAKKLAQKEGAQFIQSNPPSEMGKTEQMGNMIPQMPNVPTPGSPEYMQNALKNQRGGKMYPMQGLGINAGGV